MLDNFAQKKQIIALLFLLEIFKYQENQPQPDTSKYFLYFNLLRNIQDFCYLEILLT